MGKKSRSKEAPADAADTAELASEVAAFASQLGLASGAGGQGFDDSDFRPDKAALKLGTTETGKAKRKSTNKFRKNEVEVEAEEEEAEAAPYVKEIDPELEAAIRERRWNEGVGERPGTGLLSSLLCCQSAECPRSHPAHQTCRHHFETHSGCDMIPCDVRFPRGQSCNATVACAHVLSRLMDSKPPPKLVMHSPASD